MKNYEAMFIFDPNLKDEQLEKEAGAVEKIIKTSGAGETKYQIMGKKILAYSIAKQKEGFYVNYEFSVPPSKIVEIKDKLRHRDNILRFIIIAKEK
ncbi:MAG: 30S ribosomal protein S6 [candidate division WOR-3 bacterium]